MSSSRGIPVVRSGRMVKDLLAVLLKAAVGLNEQEKSEENLLRN